MSPRPRHRHEHDQALSEADQTAADADQTAADTDQGASDRDQAAAEADQRASDRDQAASDRELADSPSNALSQRTYQASRAERGDGTLTRQTTGLVREQSSSERDEQAVPVAAEGSEPQHRRPGARHVLPGLPRRSFGMVRNNHWGIV